MNFAESVQSLREQRDKPTEDIDFPECRSMSFREFWDWLPVKLDYYDYEDELYETLETTKHLWIKKSAGLGITEFTLRWLAWMCLKDDKWKNEQIDINIPVIVGPRLDLAITIIQRLKDTPPIGRLEKTKQTMCILNGNKIQAFPSYHVATAHGLNPKVVLLDEGDLFPPGQQIRARQVAERYIPKTNPYIIWISTPYLPGGLYEQIEHEPDDECLYTRKIMLYDRGLNKVYTPEQIEKAKLSPTFEMEYNGKYGYGVGDIFQGINDVIDKYDVAPTEYGQKCLCGDPAFGSSNFGICAGEVLDGLLYVKEAKQYPRPSPSAMLDIMEDLAHNYNDNVKIDSAHPGFIRDLEERGIPALPVNFGLPVRDTENNTVQSLRSKMTINAAQMVKTGKVRIHPMFTDLISQLRAAKFDDKGGVDKKELNFDIGDAFIMMCWDLKEFDYTSYGVSMDGNILEHERPHHGNVKVNTRVVE